MGCAEPAVDMRDCFEMLEVSYNVVVVVVDSHGTETDDLDVRCRDGEHTVCYGDLGD